ncbi:pyruvate dehydrogenase complex dihydrolipoamide acetyltransferase [Microbaculum marinum]|uniref:Acetyltransferase component of pyruvate dehydrogenase complex n=1 Tax=Microbaculum marinum TaxID=1764581 RepID=A0AAW9RLR8_9HYPH
MPIDILMPALSPTMEVGTLAKWLVKEGDSVAPGDIIAEIETDKATMEVEAVDEGTMGRILVSEGTEDVPVNQKIAVLLEEGEDESALEGVEKTSGAGTPSPGASEEAPTSPPKGEVEGSAVSKSPDQKTDASAATSPQGGEVGARSAAGEGAEATESARANGDASDGERIFASPLARRLAKEQGLELSAISGSGPHGRIVKRDIEEAAESGAAKAAPARAQKTEAAPSGAPAAQASAAAPAAVQPPSDDKIRAMFEDGTYEVVPHDNMRKVIARRLTEAKTTIPHFYLTLDVELDALLKLRSELNAAAPQLDGKPAYKLSVNDFVIKALALALKAVPEANVTWTESGMLKHSKSDVGVAVSIPGGLITPVVRNAEQKTLSVISNEMKDMAGRARERRLKPEEYQGGSSAVSNLGMYGIKDFAAVINPPHATILAVGAGEKRAVVKDDAVAIATIMSCTLSTDHRAVDGALGAQLINAFKRYIEKPMSMLV